MPLNTLKSRQDFLRVRGGNRCQNVAFLIEAKRRPDSTDPNRISGNFSPTLNRNTRASGPRFGFTITKKIGNAVIRNRIRRRLKHALGQLCDQFAQADFDYVVVARRHAATQPFDALKKDLERCLQRVHDRQRSLPRNRPPKSQPG